MKKSLFFIVFSFLFIFVFLGGSETYAAEKTNQLIIINKKTNKLVFYQDGELVKTYTVATGKKASYTPEGRFPIVNKIKNRPYYKQKIPGGAPNNPLGARWLGLDAKGTFGTTYAIHGNANPNSIGTYASAGCVRMFNKDVIELFDMVKLHTEVVITSSNKTFDAIARENGYYVGPKIEKFEKVVTLLERGKLYKTPDLKSYTGATISPQHVYALEKAGNFIKVKTWMGPLWVYSNNFVEGKSEIINTYITTFETTTIRKGPSVKHGAVSSLKPQKLYAYEKIGSWYKVNTWIGPHYLNSFKIVEGIVEPYDGTVTLTEDKKIYRNLFDTKPVGTLKAQEVKAFERINEYYRIHSWVGDVWIK